MTILRRNRLIRHIAGILAEEAGREAHEDLDAIVDAEHADGTERHRSDLAWLAVHEDAARNLYAHLTDRRVYRSPTTGRAHLPLGLPALRERLAPVQPRAGWVDRAVQRAKREGVIQ